VPNTIRTVQAERARAPHKPVIVSEVSYEGIIHNSHDETQRLTFWTAWLSGAAGFTYGANGIWQVNTREQPYGPSPHGGTWGDTPWEEAHRLPGSAQLGLARRLLERYPWAHFEPHPEWVQPSGDADRVGAPFAAGVPGQVRVIYLYDPILPWERTAHPRVLGLERERAHRAYFWDPRTGAERDLGPVQPDGAGAWQIPLTPTFQDWVLVIESAGASGESAQ
jgi:hypothetical protein